MKDIPLFLKQLEEDVANDFLPLVLIANAGSYNIGQCDDIQQLGNVCTKYTLWLHLEGVYLSTLILYSIPTAIQVFFHYLNPLINEIFNLKHFSP